MIQPVHLGHVYLFEMEWNVSEIDMFINCARAQS